MHKAWWIKFGLYVVESSGDDDVGKTIAIVVGVIGGLAAFIVLISFCRKP